MLRNWLTEWKQVGRISTGKRMSRRQRMSSATTPLQVEVLEDRTLLSTFYVDNAGDYVITNDQGAGGLDAGDTVTWDTAATHPAGPVAGLIFGTDAFATIQDAVDAAAASTDPTDTINVAAGTYTELVAIATNVSIIGTTGAIIDGGASGSVITITGATVTLDTLTIQNGNSLLGGAGINNDAASTTILDGVTVQNNMATGVGGGIFNLGTLTVQNGSMILANSAGSSGGGIFNQGTLTVMASTIDGNTASGAAVGEGGGGILNNIGTTSLSAGTNVTGNVANGASGSGGGILNRATGTVTATDSTISGNTANRAGGGIEETSTSTVGTTLTNVTLDNNVALGTPGNGGGLHVTGTSGVTITGGTVSGNSAANEGGGLWNSTGTMTVDGVTITGNTAGVEGGGIFNNGGMLNVTGSTIGDFLIENDVFSTAADAGDLVFAFVDTQDSTAGADVLLDVLEDDGTTVIDDLNAGISAGGAVTQTGSVLFNVQAPPFTGDEVTSFQLYTSVVDLGSAIAETEPNEDSTMATAITEDTLVTGTLAAADTDVFSVNVAAGSSLVVILDSLAGTDAVLELLDTDGTTVLATGTADAFSQDSAAIARALAGGTYFIRVTGDMGATGDYRFVAQVVAPTDQALETEPNDETADANALAAGQFGQGSLAQIGSNTAIDGGGIFNNVGGTTTISGLSLISNNTASNNGGGLFNLLGGTLQVTDLTQVSFNTAVEGGGIFSGSGLTVDNSTIDSNTATGSGGGISTGSTATVQGGSLITNNTAATDGGGILNTGFLGFADSTISGNTATAGTGGGIENDGTVRFAGTDTTLDINSPDTVSGSGDVLSGPAGTVTFAEGTLSTYAGTTTLTSGTTVVDGTLDGTGGPVTVQSGATLSGDGVIDRDVTVQSGGIVAPELLLSIANATLLAGSTLDVAVNGVDVAGVDYDQLNVTGTVDLTGATLVTSGTVSGTMAGDAVIIINNDGTDAVVGEFAGLAEGATVAVNGQDFRIFYGGGDGNDVVLAATPANVGAVFVNDDFTGTDGTVIADADPNTAGDQMAVIGVNAFDTIGEGVDTVDSGGTVFITDDLATDGPGTYLENLSITKDVTIVGTEDDPTAVLVDGGAAGSVFTVDPTFTVTLDSITIQNGQAADGGGINNSGNLTLTNSIVQDNSATNTGGGIWNAATGTLAVDGVTITGNTAGVEGGGIFNNGGMLNVTGSTIGDFLIENDVFSTAADAGDLVFAFVDTQDSTAGTDVLLDVLEDDGTTVIDNLNAGISAGGAVTQTGSVLFNVQAPPFTGDVVTSFQLYTSVVDLGSAIAETEPNEDSTMATAITEDTLVTGTLAAADTDVFSVNVAAGSSLVVILDSLAGTDAVLELLDTDGTTVLATGTADAFSQDSAAIARALAGGTYFIRVTGDMGATGDYRFVAQVVAPTDEVLEIEPNEDAAGANLLVAGEFAQGSLAQIGSNTALRGGGIFNNTGGTTTISGLSVISNNTATGALATDGGGGIYNDGGSIVVDSFSQITNNTAIVGSGSGGGILNNAGGTLMLTDATVAGNTANRAGGGIEDNSGTGGTTLMNVTLDDNVALGAPGNGGGLHVTGSADISITGGTVSGNSAALEGGGLWNGTGTMTISGTIIDGNTASGDAADDGGGGIFNNGGTVMISASTSVTNNVANGDLGSGGGIFNNTGGTLTVTGSTITGNTANRAGGGIEDNAGAGFGTTLTNVTLNNNVAQGGGVTGSPGNGGGLHVSGAGDVSITGGTVNGNSAALEGGGLWNGGGTMTIETVTINGNTASGAAADDGGGGIFNNAGTVDVANSTISNNVADGTLGGGGGIFNIGTLTTSNVTISGNSANGEGGGIHTQTGTATINNTTIANNQAAAGGGGVNADSGTTVLNSTIVATNLSGTADSDLTGTASGTFNLIGVDTGLTGLTDGAGGNQVGTAASPLDPLLGPLADNGGPTLTHNLLSGSPAVDAGSNPDALDFDQRLSPFARVVGDQADVGAIELQQVQVQNDILAIGTDANVLATVQVFDADTQAPLFTLTPYANFECGVRVAVGDVNMDGTPDVITAPGRDGGPHIRVFSGVDGADLGSFFAYDPGFVGGVFVASADVNGDGFADIITGAGEGGGPHVKVFSGQDFTEIFSFFAFDALFFGGARVAAGDISGDGTPDIIVGAGPGAGPHVRVFDGSSTGSAPAQIAGPLGSFYAYDQAFAGGVFVAAGDVNGDDQIDLITGAGAGGGPHVKVFDGTSGGQLAGPLGSFFAYDPNFLGGVRVAAADVNDDGQADIITVPGTGGGPHLRVFDAASATTPTVLFETFVDDADQTSGLFAAGSVDLESTPPVPSPIMAGALDDVFSDGDLLGDLLG